MFLRRIKAIIASSLALLLLPILGWSKSLTWEDQLIALANGGAVLVADDQSRPIISVNADKALIPASILKIVTAAAALHYLDPSHRFTTEFRLSHKNDLYVIGKGDPYLVSGIFIGAMLPFVFAALTMGAVGKAAYSMVEEVRYQFKEFNLLKSDKNKPDYERCVKISTNRALKEMIGPSLMAVISPIVVGIVLKPTGLGGLLMGSIATGFLLAVFLANSGGAWDNAKKYIESGNLGGKGSASHKATVIGDTVGDPCKDTSGPSLNILIKLMSIVSLVFIPLIIAFT